MNSKQTINFNCKKINILFVTIFVYGCAINSKLNFVNTDQQSHTSISNQGFNTTEERSVASGKTELSYEICDDDEKFYVEDQIINLRKQPLFDFTIEQDVYSKKNSDEEIFSKKNIIPKICIQIAQKKYSGSYDKCEEKSGKPIRTKVRPCLTQNYTNLMYTAFNDVVSCLGMKTEDSFLQLMVESGFHLNALSSKSFDAGVSQLTGLGLKRALSSGSFFRLQNMIDASSSSSCSRISSALKVIDLNSTEVSKRCEVIALPQNPYQSLVLYYLHTFKDRLYFKYEFADKFSEIDQLLDEKIKDQLVMLSYNQGISGTLKLVVGYMNNRKSVNVIPVANDFEMLVNLTELDESLKESDINRESILKRKVKKLSFAEYLILNKVTYMSKIASAKELIKKQTGQLCIQ